jgi:galactose mutarotase-like enzyme
MTVVLEAGDVRATIHPEAGARVGSLVVDGLELLVTEAEGPTDWGLFAMVPWAGRVRDGRFAFGGRQFQLPLTPGFDHAIHGTALDRAWERVDETTFAIDLGPTWPFAGRVVQRVRLTPDALNLELEVEADEPMPASCGFHPWWRRRLDRGGPAELDFKAEAMYLRDADGIPTGETVPTPPGPWDDCFTEVAAPPVLRWPGALELTTETDCAYFVVYDVPAHAVCVEPQTHPPDALNLGAALVRPGVPLRATMIARWA